MPELESSAKKNIVHIYDMYLKILLNMMAKGMGTVCKQIPGIRQNSISFLI